MRRRNRKQVQRQLTKARKHTPARRFRRTDDVDAMVYQRDQYRCMYCGFDGKESLQNFLTLSIDHLVPRALGGDEHPDNLVCACIPCNRLKRHFDPRGASTPPDGESDGRRTIRRSAMIGAAREFLQQERRKEQLAYERELNQWRERVGAKIAKDLASKEAGKTSDAHHD